MIAYCVRCGSKRDMLDARMKTLKSGKQVIEGKCPSCGSRIFSSEDHKDELLAEKQRTQ